MAITDNLTEKVCFYGSFWPAYFGLMIGMSFRAAGRQHIPTTGPVLLVSNHQSFADPWLIGNGSTRWLNYLARDSLFQNPILARAIRSYGALPIDRDFGKAGLMSVLELLAKGRAVVVFAEGERTHDGTLQDLKPGVTLLIKKAKCPVVPVGIAGCYDFWPRHELAPNPELLLGPNEGRSVGLYYGPPVDSEVYVGMKRDAILEDLKARIAASMAEAEKLRRRL
jgi:1-acyl-sn-glycerol-3-phosphate acyltransferase